MFLLRIFLLLFLVVLIIQIIGRMLFGVGRKNTGSFNNGQSTRSDRREGDIYVDFKNSNKRKVIRKDEGEYVKYEEIKNE